MMSIFSRSRRKAPTNISLGGQLKLVKKSNPIPSYSEINAIKRLLGRIKDNKEAPLEM